MSVALDEHRLGSLRWIVLTGPHREAFRALGEHVRGELTALAQAWPALPRLRRHVSGSPGSDRLSAVRRATAARSGPEWAELAAFAEGAAVPLDDLALLNFRGDLGLVDGGIGCSDLAWCGERSVIAHNEDGTPEDVGRCGLLTLAGQGRPPVTAFWYPGFLPANAFAVTGDGLVWTIDHLPVASPGDGAGRHFVGRGLQRSARTVEAAIDYLRANPSAGGFAYTIGDRAGRIVNVEAAAGCHAFVAAGASGSGSRPLLWHTNHGRYVPGAEPSGRGTSVARGEILDALAVPAGEPSPAWFLGVLAGAPLPDGVRAEPGPDSRATTLCTFVADLTAGEAVLAARGGDPIAIPLQDLAEGDPRAQHAVAWLDRLSGYIHGPVISTARLYPRAWLPAEQSPDQVGEPRGPDHFGGGVHFRQRPPVPRGDPVRGVHGRYLTEPALGRLHPSEKEPLVLPDYLVRVLHGQRPLVHLSTDRHIGPAGLLSQFPPRARRVVLPVVQPAARRAPVPPVGQFVVVPEQQHPVIRIKHDHPPGPPQPRRYRLLGSYAGRLHKHYCPGSFPRLAPSIRLIPPNHREDLAAGCASPSCLREAAHTDTVARMLSRSELMVASTALGS
jgi:hypothetical protein